VTDSRPSQSIESLEEKHMSSAPRNGAGWRTHLTGMPLLLGLLASAACASGGGQAGSSPSPVRGAERAAPSPDPRVGLGAGLFDAETAIWNMRLLSTTPPPERFQGVTNADLAFTGNYAIQGNYNGPLIWDISDPSKPVLTASFFCPASQNDVSVYANLLFVSSESNSGRLDCAAGGAPGAVNPERLRGIRIFDISDIRNPKYVANVQTCRGSHTHSVLVDPNDDENVYVYVSGSAGVRPAEELPGCVRATPDEDPNSALFRIEVIRVPLANPEAAAIVSSPRIFNDLVAPPQHGQSPADIREMEEARARGAFVANVFGNDQVLPDGLARMLLDSLVRDRSGSGAPTAADSAKLRQELPTIVARLVGQQPAEREGPEPGPTQCHDITLYPAIGLAGGACEGYGLLLDIRDPTNPIRIDAVSDSNFSYWHSATFNNDGTKILFGDEWGGGGQPKCRVDDPKEWGAFALFTLENRKMEFSSYYKLPAPQTSLENCVAHNGSLIPIPGRDVMVQAWYQGGISVMDWTDIEHPVEIAFFDRGPVNAEQMGNAGSWSVYWYNGVMVSSEIGRGLDILDLTPSPWLTQNEIDAAKSVRLDYLNAQGQPKFIWPATYSLARAYLDQLDRNNGLPSGRVEAVRQALASAERAGMTERQSALRDLERALRNEAGQSRDASKVQMLADTIRELAARI
jgi:hypothetical protein